MHWKNDSSYVPVIRVPLLVVMVLFFTALLAGACAALPVVNGNDFSYDYDAGYYALGTMRQNDGALPLDDDPAPFAIQFSPFRSAPINVLTQRSRSRTATSAMQEQLSFAPGAQDRTKNLYICFDASNEKNYSLSPITYVKTTHKRE